MLESAGKSAQPCQATVLRYAQCDITALVSLLGRFGMALEVAAEQEDIPGSFWGDEEAGLLGDRVMVRADTPVHSVLHEACHYICMDPERRQGLDTNAGGDYDEENAVCFLQIILARYLPDMGSDRMMADMDAWGYSFRLGSAAAWFKEDADDARTWLIKNAIVDQDISPLWKVRNLPI
jgi:hypothetical protein